MSEMIADVDLDQRQEFARKLVEQARSEGLNLVDPDGLLTGFSENSS